MLTITISAILCVQDKVAAPIINCCIWGVSGTCKQWLLRKATDEEIALCREGNQWRT